MIEKGVVHIISELGGCVVGQEPDVAEISESLRDYARRNEMNSLGLPNPASDVLGEWLEIVAFAVARHGTEGPVLVGWNEGQRVLVGLKKRYGYPGPRDSFDDISGVFEFPSGELVRESSKPPQLVGRRPRHTPDYVGREHGTVPGF